MHARSDAQRPSLHAAASPPPESPPSPRTTCSWAYVRVREALQLRALTHAGAAPWTSVVEEEALHAHGWDAQQGGTLLHVAAERDEVTLASAALATGADVNARWESDGFAPLHAAAKNGGERVMALLLAAGADASAFARGADGVHFTPLHAAAHADALAVTHALLAAGADLLAALQEHGNGYDVTAPWRMARLLEATPTARLLASHAAAAALPRLQAAAAAAAALAPLHGDAALVAHALLRESGAILAGRLPSKRLAFAPNSITPSWRVAQAAYTWGVRSALLDAAWALVAPMLAGTYDLDDAVWAAVASLEDGNRGDATAVASSAATSAAAAAAAAAAARSMFVCVLMGSICVMCAVLLVKHWRRARCAQHPRRRRAAPAARVLPRPTLPLSLLHALERAAGGRAGVLRAVTWLMQLLWRCCSVVLLKTLIPLWLHVTRAAAAAAAEHHHRAAARAHLEASAAQLLAEEEERAEADAEAAHRAHVAAELSRAAKERRRAAEERARVDAERAAERAAVAAAAKRAKKERQKAAAAEARAAAAMLPAAETAATQPDASDALCTSADAAQEAPLPAAAAAVAASPLHDVAADEDAAQHEAANARAHSPPPLPPWVPPPSPPLPPPPHHGCDAAPPPMPHLPPPLPPLSPDPDEEDGHICVVCLEARRAVVLLPCRHFVMCAACADGLPQPRRCPVCREPAMDVMPLFM
jgi:hypothetical protein